MDEVREALGIDKVNMDGKTIFIKENHPVDANFVLQAVLSHCSKEENNIKTCILLFHNSIGHFHNVGMKLGYNLKKLCESRFKVIEPLKEMSENLSKINTESDDFIKNLIDVIKTNCLKRTDEKKVPLQKFYLIIDDLSHLFDLGMSFENVWNFIRCLRSFVNLEPRFSLCISSHAYKNVNDETCQSNLIATGLEYFADLVVNVQPLETGYSRSVTGKMIISWKSHTERLKFKWPEEIVFLYKLFERQVKLFAPGSLNIM